MIWREKPGSVKPMLATLADTPLTGSHLVYEPKYDGIRALAEITPAPSRGSATVRLWSRLGNEKTVQFPSSARALAEFGATVDKPLVIDGELVALDKQGRPMGFQRLQNRIHVIGAEDVERIDRAQPVAFIAFDLLRDGDEDLRGLALADRRKRLETLLEHPHSDAIRLSEQVKGDGRGLHERARAEGWEGLIVKDERSPYQTGRRSPTWRKLKLQQQQEFVVGGWTEPRQTRTGFGALLLGVHDESGALTYVGHTGTGFDQRELDRVSKLLRKREIRTSPFSEKLKTNDVPHWVKPDLVAQVRFTEWTDDKKLRHPVYLGLRDDKRAADVVREVVTEDRVTPKASGQRARTSSGSKARRGSQGTAGARVSKDQRASADLVVAQLRALEDARKDGSIELPGGLRLGVTNLAKPFWPKLKLTKGDLLRYYATVSPYILPAIEDRPLVMKRFPNGVDGMTFYQHRTQKEQPPPGVRIESLPDDLDPEPGSRRFVGGSLITLLYMTQLASISQDPWFSRVQSPVDADYVAIDLDPGEGAPFSRVLEVARWVRDELMSLKVPAIPKTSGSRGLHIYIPLPRGTSYESGQLFCQIVATVVAAKHPRVATVERKVKSRPRGSVYVDYLQNILGKTLATAYSARASAFAGVSTPLTWKEIDDELDPRDFTILTAPARFEEVGDLWAGVRDKKRANLEAVFRKYASQRA